LTPFDQAKAEQQAAVRAKLAAAAAGKKLESLQASSLCMLSLSLSLSLSSCVCVCVCVCVFVCVYVCVYVCVCVYPPGGEEAGGRLRVGGRELNPKP
jgi:hypothetical protein